MHIVIAVLNDAQFNQLSQSNIPHREFPPALIERVQAIAPQMPLDELVERAIKVTLGNAEKEKYEQQEQQAAHRRVADYARQINAELGL